MEYNKIQRKEKIIQFGEGGFLRGFVDWIFQILNEETKFEGSAVVVQPIENGLSLLNGPGNDIVAVTNLMACGVHIILFTTGRGTPLGSAVPTVKISTNKKLAEVKKNWIDFDASPLLEDKTMEQLTDDLLKYVIEVASGTETKNEINDYREISIFKDGVTL